MKAQPPPLLPLLRSRFQADLLTLVLLNPEREWTLTDLAQLVGSSVATSQRISRAEHLTRATLEMNYWAPFGDLRLCG